MIFNDDTLRVIKDLNRCSSIVNKPWAIETDIETGADSFRGVILGSYDSPIWGSVFYFNLRVDGEKLSEPPKIAFTNVLFHPFIEPIYGTFCFPTSAFSLSSRMNMEKFLDEFVNLFLMKDNFSQAVNMDAARSFWSSPCKFWAVLRSRACMALKENE